MKLVLMSFITPFFVLSNTTFGETPSIINPRGGILTEFEERIDLVDSIAGTRSAVITEGELGPCRVRLSISRMENIAIFNFDSEATEPDAICPYGEGEYEFDLSDKSNYVFSRNTNGSRRKYISFRHSGPDGSEFEFTASKNVADGSLNAVDFYAVRDGIFYGHLTHNGSQPPLMLESVSNPMYDNMVLRCSYGNGGLTVLDDESGNISFLFRSPRFPYTAPSMVRGKLKLALIFGESQTGERHYTGQVAEFDPGETGLSTYVGAAVYLKVLDIEKRVELLIAPNAAILLNCNDRTDRN